MKHKIFLPLIAISAMIISCKKEKNPDPQPAAAVYDSYSNLKVGNYWIYQRFNVDESGNETATNQFDSCYVEKDTIINSKKYFKYFNASSYTGHFEYLRDSLHYIVNNYGNLFFSSENFTSNLGISFEKQNADTMVRYTRRMTDKNATTSTPWGDLTTSNSQLEIYTYPDFTFTVNPRFVNIRYAKNVGIVTRMLDFFWSQSNYIEARLVRYHVN